MQNDNKTMLRPNEETIYDIKGFKKHKSSSSIIYLKEFIFLFLLIIINETNTKKTTHQSFFKNKLTSFGVFGGQKSLFLIPIIFFLYYFYFVYRVETLVEKFVCCFLFFVFNRSLRNFLWS